MERLRADATSAVHFGVLVAVFAAVVEMPTARGAEAPAAVEVVGLRTEFLRTVRNPDARSLSLRSRLELRRAPAGGLPLARARGRRSRGRFTTMRLRRSASSPALSRVAGDAGLEEESIQS